MPDRNLARLLYVGTVVIAAGAAACFAFAFSRSVSLATQEPRAAVASWRTSAALAALAATLAADPKDARANAKARVLAIESLRRAPLNPIAMRVIGLTAAASGDLRSARRQLAYGETLSRRDAMTQLWMIEDAVQAGNIRRALIHYNRALLTSEALQPTLLPILSTAADDPQIIRDFAPVLARRPLWWSMFIDTYRYRAQSAPAIAQVMASLKLDPADPFERKRIGALLSRMVDLGATSLALQSYARLPIAGHGAGSVIDGDFEQESGIAPFGWQLADAPEHAAVRTQTSAGHGQFVLELAGAEIGEAARQFLVLPAGSYRIDALVGAVDTTSANPPFISISCSQTKEVLLNQAFPTSDQATIMHADFTVPAGCDAQWLIVYGTSRSAVSSANPWIDDIVLKRVSR